MPAHIKHAKPAPIQLKLLEAGDNFESPRYEGWVLKKIVGVKQFIPEFDKNAAETCIYCVSLNSGEVVQFRHNEEVIPLKDPVVEFEYQYN
ncbi:hypothetical protein NVP1121O_146 [Vibrio phage 1.121.O._10N.286.46.C4]|nr:hypothetical protein NVP1121O_146 [Vibrio phage 1.121.O._10N.286.46.C4]